jgi:predicted DNA-binding transcriptional regulator AlpA
MGYESRNKAKKSGRDVDMGGAFNAIFVDDESTQHVQPVTLPVPAAPDPAREMVKKFAGSGPAIALTVAEVCTLFSISRSTLHRANVPGKAVIGGSVRYDKNQLLAWWFEQQKKKVPSP